MLTLGDAVFDREEGGFASGRRSLFCLRRSGLVRMQALFADFAEDDRCFDSNCFHSKVNSHIALQNNRRQVSSKSRMHTIPTQRRRKVLTRSEHTQLSRGAISMCAMTTPGDCGRGTGPSRCGIVQVCANPDCEPMARETNVRNELSKLNNAMPSGRNVRLNMTRTGGAIAGCSIRLFDRFRRR